LRKSPRVELDLDALAAHARQLVMTRLLPAFVIAVLPILLGYVVVYRLFFYPRYLKEYRRIDTRKTYEPEVKKGEGKKAGAQTPRKAKVSLMPNKALIGLILVPLVYYVVMAFIAIPPRCSSCRT